MLSFVTACMKKERRLRRSARVMLEEVEAASSSALYLWMNTNIIRIKCQIKSINPSATMSLLQSGSSGKWKRAC